MSIYDVSEAYMKAMDIYDKREAYKRADEAHRRDMENITQKKAQATDTQVGGDHYKTMGVQPLDVTFQRYGYEGAFHALTAKVDKYLHRGKGDPIEQMDKAIHCIEMMKEYYKKSEGVDGDECSS